MICARARRWIHTQKSESLPEPLLARIERHVAGCERCRTEAAHLDAMVAALDSFRFVSPAADVVGMVSTMGVSCSTSGNIASFDGLPMLAM